MPPSDEDIKRGIKAFHREECYLHGYLQDWRSQDEFDRHFQGGPPIVSAVTPDTFVLGTMHGGRRDFYLDLVQHLIILEEVERIDVRGTIFYRSRWNEAVR